MQYRYLEVEFTEQEVIDMREKVSQNLTELARKKDTLAAFSKQMRGEISVLESETNLLADKANSGKEMRNVECKESFDYDSGVAILSRIDTGEEVDRRPLTPAEMQKDLLGD